MRHLSSGVCFLGFKFALTLYGVSWGPIAATGMTVVVSPSLPPKLVNGGQAPVCCEVVVSPFASFVKLLAVLLSTELASKGNLQPYKHIF